MTDMPAKKGWPAPLGLEGVRSRPLAECDHLVHAADFGRAAALDESAAAIIDAFPRILAGERLRDLARGIAAAHRAGRAVIFALGGHVVKVGVTPMIIDLMERGIIRAIAVNGAFAIHDAEIALAGSTSERVEEVLPDGRFGMATETAELFGRAAKEGAERETGLGRALAEAVARSPHAGSSVLGAAARLGVPITVHVAIGTDTVHMHPGVSGAAIGEASMIDFRIIAAAARSLGVWVNVGSAVILPEVFLKVVALLRNLGEPLEDVLAADLDFERHYRPETNVLRRPASKGIALTGHHEILVPLLRLAILREIAGTEGGAR